MRWLFRPSSYIVLLAMLAVGAVVWIFATTRMPTRPVPLPVAEHDREIAWLNAATGATAWQRFVQAAATVTDAEIGPEAFPRLTTAVPEIAIPLPGQSGKLRIRWYKLTSEYKADYWIKSLVERRRPPLAILGGNTTESAADQARRLREVVAGLKEEDQPLLLLTTATADRVPTDPSADDERGAPPDGIPLLDVYRERTFRFCFSNRQMGAAVTRFIWDTDELRPDALPIYTVVWQDDSYSSDLIIGFLEALRGRSAVSVASDWGLAAGFAGGGGLPLLGAGAPTSPGPDAQFPRYTFIPWSVGSFDRPNRYEAESAMEILDHLDQHPRQTRALLVLSGQSKPSRRFVRALFQLSPLRARSFVLAGGDTISFNTILRDRTVTWNIQDLPCPLVLFCHQNPVGEIRPGKSRDEVSGTEDLLLYRDIVDALYQANVCGGEACANAGALRDCLRRVRVVDGRPRVDGDGPLLFEPDGNRRSGTGEHVVWLRPHFAGPPLPGVGGERVLPEATIEVFAPDPARPAAWKRQGEPLRVQYSRARPQ